MGVLFLFPLGRIELRISSINVLFYFDDLREKSGSSFYSSNWFIILEPGGDGFWKRFFLRTLVLITKFVVTVQWFCLKPFSALYFGSITNSFFFWISFIFHYIQVLLSSTSLLFPLYQILCPEPCKALYAFINNF